MIRSFNKNFVSFTLILKTSLIALILTNSNGSNDTLSFNSGKIDVIGDINNMNIRKKIKNLFVVKNLKKSANSKKLVKVKTNKAFKIGFFIFKAKMVFISLKKTFIKILTTYYYDLKYYI